MLRAMCGTESSRPSTRGGSIKSCWARISRWTNKRPPRCASTHPRRMLDVALRGGTLVDGTGSPPRAADIGIQAGRIVSVGSLDGVDAQQTFDIGGLVLAPGFIDIHSHSDATLLVDPRARWSIAEGVTTEVIGNCGHAPAPLVDSNDVPDLVFGYNPALTVDWTTVDGYLQALE